MDVFPDLIGENEFAFFDENTYKALSGVMDDLIASYLKDYCANSNARPEIVKSIRDNLGETIDKMTFHLVLHDRGIPDLVTHISPESILDMNVDRDTIYNDLKFLEDNIDNLIPNIAGRSKTDWETFRDELVRAMTRMSSAGVSPTYPDILGRVDANKFIFYVPNAKGHSTRTGVINSKRRQWTMCLRGIEYDRYCTEHNLSVSQRRVF